jgi:hypothetical protein
VGVGVAHVDGAPHGRVLAEFAPRRAHHLRARQDLDGVQSKQDRRRHLSWQLQPVAELACEVRRSVHRQIFSRKLGFSWTIKSWGLGSVCVVWDFYSVMN